MKYSLKVLSHLYQMSLIEFNRWISACVVRLVQSLQRPSDLGSVTWDWLTWPRSGVEVRSIPSSGLVEGYEKVLLSWSDGTTSVVKSVCLFIIRIFWNLQGQCWKLIMREVITFCQIKWNILCQSPDWSCDERMYTYTHDLVTFLQNFISLLN